jgi:hypothetical protein
MNNRITASVFTGALLMSLGLVMAGCGGGSTAPVNSDDYALLSGALSVEGALLADLANPAEAGGLDEDKWALRVIDPTESVDSIVVEHEDTTFGAVSVTPLDVYLLNFSLLPAVDLSGSNAEVTPLELDIPVPVTAGTATQVDTEIQFLAPDGASSLKAVAQSDGYRIRLCYTISGPHGGTELLEIDWNHRRLRRDANGNGMLEDDEYFTDSDRNGISDNRQQGYMGGQGSGHQVQVSGPIELVDTVLGRVTVDGQVFHVDESTLIMDPTGASIKLELLEAGQQVSATGRKGRFGNVYASLIELAGGQ